MDSDIVTSEVNTSKESDGENVDDIKKFIEEQDKAILENNTATEKNESNQQNTIDENEVIDDNKIETEDVNSIEDNIINLKKNIGGASETLSVAPSVMDMILSESESRTEKKKIIKPIGKETLTTVGKGSGSMSLSVGSKVEAKDFGEYWYPAQIVEVDYEEMEVLVHYENQSKKHDEWISVSSPRLRPLGSKPEKPIPSTSDTSISGAGSLTKDELHTEDKPKLMFVVGERCLARWRDNRRFVATVKSDLGDGSYEVVFDDGFLWKCRASRLYKLKDSAGRNDDSPSIDTQGPNPILSSILSGGGPSTSQGPVIPGSSQIPAFHTHLFDPARDYLGSKSERREKKRKINIKEIFNIGQKKRKFTPKVAKPVVPKDNKHLFEPGNVKKDKPATVVTAEGKQEVPDAVASIIGTIDKADAFKDDLMKGFEEKDIEVKDEVVKSDDPVEDPAEEELLENFETQDEVKHEEVIDRIKEVIIKLEGSLIKAETEDSHVEKKVNTVKLEEVNTVNPEKSIVEECNVEEFRIEDPNLEKLGPEKTEEETIDAVVESVAETADLATGAAKPKKSVSKLKRSKKLRLLQEKKVKKQVEKVKSELEEMKRQVEEMRKQMLLKAVELPTSPQKGEMPESFLLPGEWCCKWVNGQPVGTVSEIETAVKVDAHNKPALPRRSVQVEDKRLPVGWTKHMVRRSYGHSAGKWDVVLVSPDSRKLHTKSDMRNYMENNPHGSWVGHERALFDFGVHLKLSRRMGWVLDTPDGAVPGPAPAPAPAPGSAPAPAAPVGKKRKLTVKRRADKVKIKRKRRVTMPSSTIDVSDPGTSGFVDPTLSPHNMLDNTALEDGYVYVGSLKVQLIDNLLRCPAEGCYKNFRNNTLLKMHIKHYHRELRKMMGATPKVLDLAHARTKPNQAEIDRIKGEMEHRTIKVKLPRLPKRYEETKQDVKETNPELNIVVTPFRTDEEKIPRSLDSPKLRQSLMSKPPKRPRVLLPVRRPEPDERAGPDAMTSDFLDEGSADSSKDAQAFEPLDFETAISTHTVTKPSAETKKGDKRRKTFAAVSRSEEEYWDGEHSDVETRSSCPRSGSPDSKNTDGKMDSLMMPASSESNDDLRDNKMYMFSETGERIKLVHMKREEIINCHCGVCEEDGLMVQCELCLCWQHALCHNIQKESEVPEKYTCSICLNPRRGRRSRRFVHDQDRLYEGLLPGARPCDTLRRSHELAGNLLRVQDALHALRVKHYVATKKDHPKLYLWAKDWETSELSLTKLNSDYSDLNIMIADIGKENLPMRPAASPEGGAASAEELEGGRYTHRESQLGPQALLGGLLASPGGASLDLPISTSELERLAKSVQAAEEAARTGPAPAPQPEAAIEDSACRAQLLRHIQRCQALVDARLDSIEAQVAELESQDPSFEDDETADFFPRTKQTVQMLMRDLDTMEELGIIT